MRAQRLLEDLVASIPKHADEVPIYRTVTMPIDRQEARAARALKRLRLSSREEDRRWEGAGERRVLHLTGGARLSLFPASGAFEYAAGLSPASEPFAEQGEPEDLARLAHEAVHRMSERFDMDSLTDVGSIGLERVFRILGRGVDREARITSATLFRAVAAYRWHIDELPVLGPASLAVQLTGQGTVSALRMNIREVERDPVDVVRVRAGDELATHVVRRLEGLMGGSKADLDDVAHLRSVSFGYLSSSRRQAQRMLEPTLTAQIDIDGEDAQGYLLTAPAGEVVYDSRCVAGAFPPVARTARRPARSLATRSAS